MAEKLVSVTEVQSGGYPRIQIREGSQYVILTKRLARCLFGLLRSGVGGEFGLLKLEYDSRTIRCGLATFVATKAGFAELIAFANDLPAVRELLSPETDNGLPPKPVIQTITLPTENSPL